MKGTYEPKKAQQKAYVRRRSARFQGKKVALNKNLRDFVEEKLKDDVSPGAISGRLRHQEKDLPFASKNSIYRFLKSPYGRALEYEREQKMKRGRHRRKVLSKLADRTFIDERPNSIEMRENVGDVEGDFIVSGKTGKGSLLVVVDRKLRTSFLEKILPLTIEEVHQAFLRIQKRFPELQSMTTDNDILFQKHKELEALLGIKIYFCHPYHSWEKGTVENTNKIIRKDIPKGSDLSKYSKAFIQRLEEKLNRRPLKCLNYLTPKEALLAHRKEQNPKTF